MDLHKCTKSGWYDDAESFYSMILEEEKQHPQDTYGKHTFLAEMYYYLHCYSEVAEILQSLFEEYKWVLDDVTTSPPATILTVAS